MKARDIILEMASEFIPASFGSKVSGLVVRSEIPNTSSIAASLGNNYRILGLREVPMSLFSATGRHYSVSGQRRIDKLAEEIKHSREISPLIVVKDSEGYYVLEGATRLESLFKLKVKSFPALVVEDLGSLEA